MHAYFNNALHVLVFNKYMDTDKRKKMLQQLSWSGSVVLQMRHRQAVTLTSAVLEAGGVEFAHVKLHPNDGKHNNGEEQQQANLKKWNHGFHYRLQHHLEA